MFKNKSAAKEEPRTFGRTALTPDEWFHLADTKRDNYLVLAGQNHIARGPVGYRTAMRIFDEYAPIVEVPLRVISATEYRRVISDVSYRAGGR